jgi:hypothetical protein
MDAAARLLRERLIPAAREGLDPLVDAMDGLELLDVQRCLIFMVHFDRLQRAESGAAVEVDLPALRDLAEAAKKSQADVQEVVLNLSPEATFEALGELVFAHRDRAVKRRNARLN